MGCSRANDDDDSTPGSRCDVRDYTVDNGIKCFNKRAITAHSTRQRISQRINLNVWAEWKRDVNPEDSVALG